MNSHTLAGIVIAVTVLLVAALFYESDFREWRERSRQQKRRRRRANDENSN